jgi:hypothetical protein
MEDALIHLRVPAATKARWVQQSRAAGMRLTDWITEKVESAMTIYTVLLDNATVGTLTSDMEESALMGLPVTVDLRDENGLPIKASGKVVEVLESKKPWE